MPEYEDDRLREEEELSGFDSGEQGDETFAIESMDEYEGELPDFDFSDELDEAEEISSTDDPPEEVIEEEAPMEETETSEADDETSAETEEIEADETPVEETPDDSPVEADETPDDSPVEAGGSTVSEAEEIEVPEEGSVWDLFDEEAPEASGDASDSESDETSPVEETKVAPESTDPETPTEEEQAASEETTTDETPADSEEISIGNVGDGEDGEVAVIDDDLKSLLEDELDKSKQRKEEKDAQAQEDAAEIEENQKDFVPVEDSEETEFIDLTEFDADRPSTFGLDAHPDTGVPEGVEEGMHLSDHSKKPAVQPDETGEIKEKRRKKFPWRAVAFLAAIVLILAMLSFGTYYVFFSPDDSEPALADSSKTKDTLIVEDKNKEKKKEMRTEKKIESEIDSAQFNKEKADAGKPEDGKKDTAGKYGPVLDTEKKDEPVKVAENKPEKNAEKKPETIPVEKKTDKPKEKKKTVIKTKPKTKKEKAPEKKKTEPKKIAHKITKEPKPETKTVAPEPTDNREYTVQIYSSPNKDDAQEWLDRLKRKNVQGAFISSQKIRDKLWYRVRFGAYKTRDEARTAALQYGFTQSWIDRVK